MSSNMLFKRNLIIYTEGIACKEQQQSSKFYSGYVSQSLLWNASAYVFGATFEYWPFSTNYTFKTVECFYTISSCF